VLEEGAVIVCCVGGCCWRLPLQERAFARLEEGTQQQQQQQQQQSRRLCLYQGEEQEEKEEEEEEEGHRGHPVHVLATRGKERAGFAAEAE
jgi:hypothetical protein